MKVEGRSARRGPADLAERDNPHDLMMSGDDRLANGESVSEDVGLMVKGCIDPCVMGTLVIGIDP